MKYYNYLLCAILSCLVTFASGCNDDDNDKKAAGLICFAESGHITAKFSYTDDDAEFKINVLNKGMGTLAVPITICTQDELNEYNQKYSTDYSLLPEETYELSETSVSFTSAEKSKDITLTIYPKKLFDAIRNDAAGKVYALPLKIGSQSSCETIYVIEITYPELRLEGSTYVRLSKDEEIREIEARTYEEEYGSLKATPNKGDVDMPLVLVENAEEWLKNYNQTYETDYKLLPSTAYELGRMTGKEGEEKCTTSVKIKRTLSTGTPLEFGKYILPVQLSGVDSRIAVSREVHVITVSNSNNYEDTGRDYDDGTNIVYHVKLAIDKEGYEMMNEDMEFFKNNFEIQWEEINTRFNALDKKGILKRNYIFVPDLEDIIVFEYKNKDSNWDVAYNYSNRIDKDKFQLVVTYDFFKQEDEGGGGYGGKTPEGVDHIKVTCYSENADGIRRMIGLESLTDESIVHELGHFRGLIDTYWCEVPASKNKVNNKGFQPERGNMMGACYQPTHLIEWSEYEMYVINATGAPQCSISKTVAKYFADNVQINVTEDGQPSEGFTLKFYPFESDKIEKEKFTYQVTGNQQTVDAKRLFWVSEEGWINNPGNYYKIFLIEAISKKTGKKAYLFLPVYDVHRQGLIDKSERPITGTSTFRTTIDIK